MRLNICPCCMEEHEPRTIKVKENNLFKDIMVEYEAEYNYCINSDETYADESQWADLHHSSAEYTSCHQPLFPL